MVIELQDLVGLCAAQHIDQVVDPEALPGAIDRAQGLARGLGAVPGIHRLQAGITIATGRRQRVAEVLQQGLPAAGGDLAQAQHGVQAMLLRALVFLAALGGFHHLPQFDHVLQTVDHPGIRRLAIAAGATGLLVVGLYRLGHVQVCHEAHVGLVYAHAEGNGGDDDDTLLTQETRLVVGADIRRQAGVIGQGIEALLLQPVGGLLGFLAGQAVDDTRVLRVFIL